MSRTGKIILWVIVAAVVVGGGIWWWMASQNGAPSSMPTAMDNGSASTSYPQGNSDQSINQDMASLDAQMNGLSSDSASVAASMNDQPVQQAAQ